jgi:C4-dicarboxylate transporter/malic acid transport protein
MLTLPLSRLQHPREVVRQFTPNWFTATMGTGILALALNQFPLAVPGLKSLGEGLWLVNIGAFVLFTLLYSARWVFFFHGAKRIFQHSVMCMFFGAIPMGLATIINGFLAFGTAHWGDESVHIADTLWWLDAAMALACAWLVPYLMFTRQDHRLENMTAVWLLPIVAAEVAAASGGLLIGHLEPGVSAARILLVSYVLWGMSVLPATGILTILFLRMALHKLPKRDMAVSSWLSLGPIGTGALGLMLLGEQAPRVLIGAQMVGIASAASGLGVVGAAILWGFGLWWLALALLITLRYLREGLPFNMGWWAFTFPMGVYSVATLTLGRMTGISLFEVLGAGFVVMLAAFWLVVFGRTLYGGYHGHLFVSPCLSDGTGLRMAPATSADIQLRQSRNMEAIGTVAGGIAHDFNNILGAILGYGELAQNAAAPEDSVMRRYLDNVMHAAGRAKALVERILAFGRSGEGERGPINVQAVIEETLELLAASLTPGVRLNQWMQAGDAAIAGDATQLHRVAMNLCTNALQAMEHGGVLDVTLDRADVAQDRRLSHGNLAPGAYVRLCVSDTGSGIPPQVLDRMFDPFFTTKRVGEGSGLGLSLVHGIVADLGGAIDVCTAVGRGTSFTIWLPTSGEAAAPTDEVEAGLPRGEGQAVVIVDDEKPLVALAEEMLAKLGYEPIGFCSSEAALEAFRKTPQRFDIVLTDETMPELVGIDLAREMRLLRPDTPIVLMSGYNGLQLDERTRAAGIREVLRKPLQSKDLANCLGRVLRIRGLSASGEAPPVRRGATGTV